VLNLANDDFILTVEEHILSGGFGSMMLEVAATNDFGGKSLVWEFPTHITQNLVPKIIC